MSCTCFGAAEFGCCLLLTLTCIHEYRFARATLASCDVYFVILSSWCRALIKLTQHQRFVFFLCFPIASNIASYSHLINIAAALQRDVLRLLFMRRTCSPYVDGSSHNSQQHELIKKILTWRAEACSIPKPDGRVCADFFFATTAKNFFLLLVALFFLFLDRRKMFSLSLLNVSSVIHIFHHQLSKKQKKMKLKFDFWALRQCMRVCWFESVAPWIRTELRYFEISKKAPSAAECL